MNSKACEPLGIAVRSVVYDFMEDFASATERLAPTVE